MSRNFAYLLPTGWQRLAQARADAVKRMEGMGLDPRLQASWDEYNRVRIREQSLPPSLRAGQPEEAPAPPMPNPASPAATPDTRPRHSGRDAQSVGWWLEERGYRRHEGGRWLDDQGREAAYWYDRGLWHAVILEGAQP